MSEEKGKKECPPHTGAGRINTISNPAIHTTSEPTQGVGYINKWRELRNLTASPELPSPTSFLSVSTLSPQLRFTSALFLSSRLHTKTGYENDTYS